LDSGSQFAPSTDHLQGLESQLKASPIIHDILDRLVRCEYSTREIQRDLSDVHRKVDLLVERSFGVVSRPEFKDPFATPAVLTHNVLTSLNGPRQSVSGGSVAPNQPAPSDDITQISQRLNTLTTSVGQLLALQTQQHIQSTNAGISNNHIISPSQLADLVPNQLAPIPPHASILAHGLPNRPDLRPSPRAPNPPMRTWSAGAIDLPIRPPDTGFNRHESLLRDKRRSASGMARRESAGVCISV
jgi:translation initiation factor 4A